MRHEMPEATPRRWWLQRFFFAVAAAVVSACKFRRDAPDKAAEPEASGVTGPAPQGQGTARASTAASARAYRQDAASHLYGLNAERIYKGRLPPELYAIGVINVEIDRNGRATRLTWLRAPRHAPEVVAEIERTLRQAAPFPAPSRLGKVVYTDTWLWHKSGKFQLDTLTEGQD